MANTIVTDALKFANVTNVAAGMDSGVKKVSDEMDFTQMLGSVANGSDKNNPTDTVSNKQTIVDKSSTSNLTESNKNVTKENKSEGINDKDIAKSALDKAEKVKSTIKEKLGVSDEEIENAMESMGLSMQDLLNLDSIKALMMNLSGVSDSLDIITNGDLYSAMKDIFVLVENSLNELSEEFDIKAEDLQSLFTDESFEGLINSLVDASLIDEATDVSIIDDSLSLASNALEGADEELSDAQLEALVTDTNDASDNVVLSNEAGSNASNNSKDNETSSESIVSSVEDANKKIAGEMKNDSSEETSSGKEVQVKVDRNVANEHTLGQTVTTTTTVNSVGEVIETVQSFASAYSDANEIVSQIISQVKVSIDANSTSLQMQLHPASLGTVQMQISSVNGSVTAQLLVENESVKAAIESQLIQLEQTFEQQGQKVDAVEVAVANYNFNKDGSSNFNENKKEDDFSAGRITSKRRSLNLDDMTDEEIEDLEEEERVEAEVMKANGVTVDYKA